MLGRSLLLAIASDQVDVHRALDRRMDHSKKDDTRQAEAFNLEPEILRAAAAVFLGESIPCGGYIPTLIMQLAEDMV